MSRPLYVLLPPSESKAAGGRHGDDAGRFGDQLGVERGRVRADLADLLASTNEAALARTLGVRGPLLERALIATDQLVRGVAPVLPAWQRYEGVVWTHLRPDTLSPAQRRRLLIPSGLYGLTTGEDRIVDYRLTMKVTLGSSGNVAKRWQPLVTAALCGLRGEFVNLLPKEHELAIDVDAVGQSHVVHHVRFVQSDGEGAAGHDAKAVKGVVARALLDEGLDALDGFTWQGWRAVASGDGVDVIAPARRVS